MYTPNGASDIIFSIHNCQVNVSKTDQNRMPSLTCVRLELLNNRKILPFCCRSLSKFACNPHKHWCLVIVWIIQTTHFLTSCMRTIFCYNVFFASFLTSFMYINVINRSSGSQLVATQAFFCCYLYLFVKHFVQSIL